MVEISKKYRFEKSTSGLVVKNRKPVFRSKREREREKERQREKERERERGRERETERGRERAVLTLTTCL